MSDVLLNSLKTSSLQKALAGSVDNTQWTATVPKSSVPAASELVRIPFDRSETAALKDNRCTNMVQIPKLGLITSAFVRIEYGGVKAAAGDNRLYVCDAPGISAIESFKLSTHSREICSIDSRLTMAKIEEMPAGKRALYKRMAGYHLNSDKYLAPADIMGGDPLGISTALTADSQLQPVVLYCPVLLSPFLGNSKNPLWASFCETLSLEVITRPANQIWSQITGSTASAPTSVKMELCLNTTVLDDAYYRKAVASNFKVGRSLQTVNTKYSLLGSEEFEKTAFAADQTASTASKTFKIRTTGTELCRALHIFVFRKDGQSLPKNTTAGDHHGAESMKKAIVAQYGTLRASTKFEHISNVKFSAGGRTLIDASPSDALMFTAAGPWSGESAVISHLHANEPVGHFSYRFDTKNHDNAYTGGISLAGLSSQSFQITAKIKRLLNGTTAPSNVASAGATGDKDLAMNYRCEVWAESYQVVSINSSDGAVKTALSV